MTKTFATAVSGIGRAILLFLAIANALLGILNGLIVAVFHDNVSLVKLSGLFIFVLMAVHCIASVGALVFFLKRRTGPFAWWFLASIAAYALSQLVRSARLNSLSCVGI
jgi:hypothetical protein